MQDFRTQQDEHEPTVGDDNPMIGEEGQEPGSMSLLGGVASGSVSPEGQPLGLEFSEDKPRRVSQSTLVILAVVMAAVVAIVGMKLTSGPMTADAQTQAFVAEIDTAIQKLKNPQALDASDPLKPENLEDLLKTPDEIVEQFDRDLTDKQVPVEQVKQNPFVFKAAASQKADPEASAKAKAAERLAMLQKLKAEADRLKLQSIMDGPRPIAVINGEFYREGAQVGSFKIREITGIRVELEAQGVTVPLEVVRPGQRR